VKAALCKSHGGPDSLVIEEIPEPALLPGLVRLGVHACGVNFPDVLMVAGKYQVQPPLPFSPGAEVAGEILEVAEDVKHLQPGQHVIALTACGGMAEQVCVPAVSVIPTPENMDYTTAAGFMLTYGTSYHALKQRAQLKPGETVLVLGAAGGVGLAAVELAALLGAKVIAAASTDEKLQLAKTHGAEHGINYTEQNLKEAVMQITGGKGVDVIYDPVGGELFDQCMRCMAWNGRLLVIGFASGAIPKAAVNLPLLKGFSIVGVFWGSFTQREPAVHLQNTQELLALFAEGKLHPRVTQLFPLEQAGDALKTLAERKAMGKVIVTVP
jgi:NADPH2:quinone reductase